DRQELVAATLKRVQTGLQKTIDATATTPLVFPVQGPSKTGT
ncbi:MAG: hypothetical protein JWM16_4183, partial [Verrucomicrobiales bacterium]|nr:hypothetical protein [Verrucomicrobiales bacterium]